MTTRPIDETVPDALAGERIDRVVAIAGDITRSVAGMLVDSAAVLINGEAISRRSHRLAAGDRVQFDAPIPEEDPGVVADPTVEIPIVHRDEHLYVIDKPAGLLVHPGAGNPTGTLVHGLLAIDPGIADVGEPHRPGIVHRLDRETSGLLVVARTEEARSSLVDALSQHLVLRRYRTLVWGHLPEQRGLIDAPIGRSPRDPTSMAVVVGGKEARTHYDVVRRFDEPEVTELLCELETGRTHQIRVHLKGLGHPVVGDRRYNGAKPAIPLQRQFLHAEHLALNHPVTGERLAFDSELPADLRHVLDSFD